MLHKPALLGILGAIIGLEGYQQLGKTPEYYEKLKDIKIGIEPLEHEKGNFQKTVIKYSNTIGYANKGATYLTEEATLIAPAYRCYLLLDLDNKLQSVLYKYVKEGKSEFLPYFGKNEFYAWWNANESFKEYDFDPNREISESYKIKTLFLKNKQSNQGVREEPFFDLLHSEQEESNFLYFEILPIGFTKNPSQYITEAFVYTTFMLKPITVINSLYYLNKENYYIQLN